MKHLILVKNSDIRTEELDLKLKKLLGDDYFNVVDRKDADDVISLLEMVPEIHAILTPEKVQDEKTLKIISDFLTERKLSIPILSVERKNIDIMTKELLSLEKSEKTGVILPFIPPESKSRHLYPIPQKYLRYFPTAICDFYKRLNDEDGPSRYEKVITGGRTINIDLFQELKDKGVSSLYISARDHEIVLDNLYHFFNKKISDKLLPSSDRIYYCALAYSIAKKEINSFGFEKGAAILAELSLQQTLEEAMSITNIDAIFESGHRILSSDSPLSYKSAFLNTLYSTFFISKMAPDPTNHQVNLGYLSFYSDISLVDDDYYDVRSNELLESGKLSPKEMELIGGHAESSAKILELYRQAPKGVSALIKLHHGSENGQNFAKVFPGNANHLITLFAIIDECTYLMMNKDIDTIDKKMIDQISTKFEGPAALKIIRIIKENLPK